MAIIECTDDSGSAAPDQIDVEIVYAKPETIWRRNLQLAAGTVVRDALTYSGFFEQFSDYSVDTVQVGIYGQACSLDRPLVCGDRIEVYRPLVFDPMESRRRRAQHRQRIR